LDGNGEASIEWQNGGNGERDEEHRREERLEV
jgi:hypothetical protein